MNMTDPQSSNAVNILATWWSGLENNRRTRAELRRCKTTTEVMLTPAFQRLLARLKEHLPLGTQREERLATVIGLLAHVNHSGKENLAELMAGSPPPISELRFRRLLQRDDHELFLSLIRILRMLQGKANLPDLVNSVFYWGDKVKKRWAYTYFTNTPVTTNS